METPQLQDNSSEELYNLDNDSFLNSLEAISFPDTWPEAKLWAFPKLFLSLDPGSLHYSALLRSLRSLDLHRLFGHLWASYMLIHVSSLEFQQKCKLRGVLILAEVLTFWSFIKVVSFLESHGSCSAFLALGQNFDLGGLSTKLWVFMSSGSFTSDKRQSASTCLAVSGEKDKNHIIERWWHAMVKTEPEQKSKRENVWRLNATNVGLVLKLRLNLDLQICCCRFYLKPC